MNKGYVLAGLVVVGVAVQMGMPKTPAPVVKPAATVAEPTKAAIDPQAVARTNRAYDALVDNGLVLRWKKEERKAYVDLSLWAGFELDAKEKIVRVIAAHDTPDGQPDAVTIYASRSGKELASFGVFRGVRIETE